MTKKSSDRRSATLKDWTEAIRNSPEYLSGRVGPTDPPLPNVGDVVGLLDSARVDLHMAVGAMVCEGLPRAVGYLERVENMLARVRMIAEAHGLLNPGSGR